MRYQPTMANAAAWRGFMSAILIGAPLPVDHFHPSAWLSCVDLTHAGS